MRALILGLLTVLMVLGSADGGYAQPAPQFKLGFKLLADLIPKVVGVPLEDEHYGANGDSLQQTTTGLMVWRKADNWTAFTDGWWTWINGPFGVQQRTNNQRFQWEIDGVANLLSSAPTPTPTRLPLPVPTPTSTPVPTTPTPVPSKPFDFSNLPAPNLDNQVEFLYYDVYGITAEDLLPQLMSSPCGPEQWGCMSWVYSVSISPRSGGGVTIPDGAPLYHIRVLLPRWEAPAAASPDLVASWLQMKAILRDHEEGHVDIALAGVASMRQAILSAPTVAQADAARLKVEQQIDQQEADYDQVTDHGRAQGVHFP